MAPVRSGVFISHAHEDADLAADLAEMLKVALSLEASEITCTSDAAYGLTFGQDLRDEIGRRLDSAQALFLLVSPASKGREWVMHECGFAAAREDMQFHVVMAVPSHIASVPEPQRGRVAVTLSDGRSVHAFVGQVQKALLKESPISSDLVRSELALVDRCTEIGLREARALTDAATAERDKVKGELGTQQQQFDAERRRTHGTLRALKVMSAILVAAVATAIAWNVWNRGALERRFGFEKEQLQNQWSSEMQSVSAERDEQQRSWPFSGLVLDSQDRVVRCTEVQAHFKSRKEPVIATCDRVGQFTFTSGLGVLADEPFSLTVMVGGERLSPASTTRREVPAAIYTRGGGQ